MATADDSNFEQRYSLIGTLQAKGHIMFHEEAINMTIDAAIELLKWLALFTLGAASIYYQTNTKISCYVAKLIDEAEHVYEDVSKSGGEKFEWVVTALYSMVPAVLKPFITRQVLENLVQSTFDAMEQYALTQMGRLAGGQKK